MHYDETPHEPTGAVEDDRLRLLFTCCQPALAPQARIALTLRLLGGLTVAEIGHAFLVPETTMAQRITRATPPKTPPSAPTCAGSAASWSERSNDSGMRSSAPVVSGLVIPAEYLEELRRRPIKAMTRARGPHPQI